MPAVSLQGRMAGHSVGGNVLKEREEKVLLLTPTFETPNLNNIILTTLLQISTGTIISPFLESVESLYQSAAASAAPIVQFVADIPALFERDQAASESDHAPPPSMRTASRTYRLVVPEMCVGLSGQFLCYHCVVRVCFALSILRKDIVIRIFSPPLNHDDDPSPPPPYHHYLTSSTCTASNPAKPPSSSLAQHSTP